MSVPGWASLTLCSPLASGALLRHRLPSSLAPSSLAPQSRRRRAPSARSLLTADVVLGAQQLGCADRDHIVVVRVTEIMDSFAALESVNDNRLLHERPYRSIDVR